MFSNRHKGGACPGWQREQTGLSELPETGSIIPFLLGADPIILTRSDPYCLGDRSGSLGQRISRPKSKKKDRSRPAWTRPKLRSRLEGPARGRRGARSGAINYSSGGLSLSLRTPGALLGVCKGVKPSLDPGKRPQNQTS